MLVPETREESVVSQEFQNVLAAMKAQRSDQVPAIPELRVGIEALGRLSPPPEGLRAETVDAGGVSSDWVSAPGARDDATILYLHGGGYCIGSPTSHRNLTGRLSRAAGVRALVPDYRLAPEHPHPAAVRDATTVYRWLLEQGADPEGVVVAGDSAGGGLAAALQVQLRDSGDPLPRASALISPWADLDSLGPISDDALEDDYLRPETLEFFRESYLDGTDPREVLASPALADLRGLPPMLVYAGEREILLDTARRLVASAVESGVDAELFVAPEMPHVPQLFAGLFPEADAGIDVVASYIRSKLG